MKESRFFVKGLVLLSLVGTLAMADGDKETSDDNQKLNIKSSIQISDNATEEVENSSAKIGVTDVTKVIKGKSLGKILSVKLENENGNLVYIAEVVKNDQTTDIIVDAGNGKILASMVDKKDSKVHEDDKEEDSENDENES